MANHLVPGTPDREGLLRAPQKDGASPAADGGQATHPLLTLQRQLGNAAIQRLLAQREAAPEEEEVQMKRDPSAVQRAAVEEEEPLQMKRDPSAVQRAAEEEEEPVQMKRDPSAVQREAMPEEEEPIQAKRDPAAVQREAAPDEEEIQMKRAGEVVPEVGAEGGPASPAVASAIQAKRGAGSPLDSGTRASMEASFGTSFEDVRLHTDSDADGLNRKLGAKAFTTGSDIFFRQDTSPGDASLLAHELTHVVQQRDMAPTGGGLQVGPAGDHYEAAADAAGAAASAGAPVQAKRDPGQD